MNIGGVGYTKYFLSMQGSTQAANPAGSVFPSSKAQLPPDYTAGKTPAQPQLVPDVTGIEGNFTVYFNSDGDSAQLSYPFAFYNQPMNLPEPIIGADFTPDKLIPEMPGSGLLDEIKPDGGCQTCANRKYVDGSDDASVSYQTPTKINPSTAGIAVAAHEQEHVRKEKAYAERDGREVVQSSVTLHYDCCPECGKSYVSGGTTRTTTVGKSDNNAQNADNASADTKNQPAPQSAETQ